MQILSKLSIAFGVGVHTIGGRHFRYSQYAFHCFWHEQNIAGEFAGNFSVETLQGFKVARGVFMA